MIADSRLMFALCFLDLIDIVKDQLYGSDFVSDEDPTTYVSEKTRRGPLVDTWIEDCVKLNQTIMCAYKLCSVEFKYWGMQTKVERFIHDTGTCLVLCMLLVANFDCLFYLALRRVMLRAHRQAWAWQDEWHGLNMEDIRKLELQTQELLAKKMAVEAVDVEGEGSADQTNTITKPATNISIDTAKPVEKETLSSPSKFFASKLCEYLLNY